MKKECKALRGMNLLVTALSIVLGTASSAFANNAPGPLAAVSILSLFVLIVALTFAGGGYNVMKLLDDAKYPSKTKRAFKNIAEFIAGIVLFFVGLFATILGVLGFSLYAIGRGVKMLRWASAAGQEGVRPAHLAGANPKRLKLAGAVLIVAALFVFGYSLVNIDEVTGTADYRKRGHAAMLNAEAKNAWTAAEQYLLDNPKVRVVTCEDLVKAGLIRQSKNIACFSDLTAASGSIRMTGPDTWGLQKPFAVVNHAGELDRAEP